MTSGEQEANDADPMREAARWFARLSSEDATEADRRGLQAWLSSAPEHVSAYEKMQRTWAYTAGVQSRDAVVSPARQRWRPWAIAASVALLAGMTALYASLPLSQTYTTSKGQRLTLSLSDGSVLELNTATTVRVRIGRGTREVELSDGEAFFKVAPNTNTPFFVHAGHADIRVVGTEFTVLRKQASSQINVFKGIVAVSADLSVQRETDSPVELTAGHRITYGASGALGPVESASAAATAWRQGRVVYERKPLSYVVEDLSRYVDRPIVLSDPSDKEILVNVVLQIESRDAMLKRLGTVLPISVSIEKDGTASVDWQQ